jgi:type IV secretion system protein VirB8
MFNKKTSSPAVNAALSRSVNFELTLAELARRSERHAWSVAYSAVALALILAGGYFYMLPLKQKVPFLVMADGATGVATVARLSDEVNVQRITTNEAINRSNVAHFVLARESYDVAFLDLHDWNTVLTMAAPDVAAAYRNVYSSENPDNPYQTYGRERAIRINIESIVLIGGGNRPYKGATVRFQRSIYNKQSGSSAPLDNKIATLEFSYKPDLRMDEQARLQNPLGFQVTAYRTDSDFSSPLPAATPQPLQPVQPAAPASAPAVVTPPPPVPQASAASAPASPAPHHRHHLRGVHHVHYGTNS